MPRKKKNEEYAKKVYTRTMPNSSAMISADFSAIASVAEYVFCTHTSTAM